MNDRTVEGIRHRRGPAFSVQYHPEAGPGPHDPCYHVGTFRRLMAGEKCRGVTNSAPIPMAQP
ncbi:MAG: hypothetical protein FJ224_11605 [Lentisphaerae bacterium]|nr:hypothetical protein [Lentisphaerota bacterium]